MFKNYFIHALRNLRKERFYTFINVLGLSISVFSALVLGLYVMDEWSYDKLHLKSDRIYRIYGENSGRQFAVTPYAWRDPLIDEFPEIDDLVRIATVSTIFKIDGQIHSEPTGIAADTSLFNIFSFPWISGDESKALEDPNSVLLTPRLADKYFSDSDPIGKLIEIDLFGHTELFKVEGIIACPIQSHIQFDYVLPHERVIANNGNPQAYENWSVHFIYSYLLANQPLDRSDIKAKLNAFLHRHHGEWLSAKYNPQVEPLTDIYLISEKEFEWPTRGSKTNLQILSAVGLSILLIGIINFINMTTSRAFTKMKGVSIRRVFGSTKRQIVLQFLIEGYLMLLAGFVIALVLIQLGADHILALTDKDLSWHQWMHINAFFSLVLAWLGLGLVIGVYPGLLISGFHPKMLLSTKSKQSRSQILAKKILVSIQIGASGILIVSTLVMWSQVDFMGNKPLGFEKDQLLILNDAGLVSANEVKFNALKSRLQNKPYFKELSSMSSYPGTSAHWSSRYFLEGDTDESSMSIVTFFSDFKFVEALGLKIVSGRDFDPARPADSINFIINEACWKFFSEKDSAWASDPFAQTLDWRFNKQKGKVIGIVKDFHFESLKNEIKPMIITEYLPFTGFTGVKLVGGNYQAAVSDIEEIWAGLFGDIPFGYTFADTTFRDSFASELKLGQIFIVFASLSIFIAILGLLGLAASLSHEKSREISIRKIIGASRPSIVGLLVGQFALIVLIANIASLPLAYWLTNGWLESFSYRIEWPYQWVLVGFTITMAITVLTILYHVLRVSNLNPTQVLARE